MKKDKAILIGFGLPNSEAAKLFESDASPAIQTHKFAWSLARSIHSAGIDLTLISTHPIQNFPLGKKLLFMPHRFTVGPISGNTIFFINTLVLKHLTRLVSILFSGSCTIRKERISTVFIHGLHSPFLLFGALCRWIGHKKVVVILTDPPGVILPSDSIFAATLKRLDAFIIRKLLSHMSGCIALSKHLCDRYTRDIPSLVFPGIANHETLVCIERARAAKKSNDVFTVAYAGGLSKAYGVDILVDAILSHTSMPLVLKIYGRGEQEDHIKDIARKDSRIVYGGFIEHEKLMPELLSADLLINPRPSHFQFSTESFPSKLIEYLALGKPVLTTNLKSIPDDFKKLFYYIEDESPNGVAHAIEATSRIGQANLQRHATQARDFVVKNTSESATGIKIKSFIQDINTNCAINHDVQK